MSANFRISNRLSANSAAMRYMDHPPVPSSLSRLSVAIKKLGSDVAGQKLSRGASHHSHQGQHSKTGNNEEHHLLHPTHAQYSAHRTGSYMPFLTMGSRLYMPQEVDDCEDHDGKMTPTQKKIFITGLLSLFTLQNLFLSVETIIPIYLEKYHTGLNTLQAAFIMSATEYSGLIFSPIIGSLLDKFGRKTIIVLGFLIITLGTVALALLDFIKDDMQFFYLALVFRFIQGIGDQFVQTTVYSVLSSTFPTTREKILGYAETAAGVGLMIGPNIAGPINQILGYLPTYMIFASMLVVSGTISFFLLPSSLNDKPVITQQEFDDQLGQNKKTGAPYSWYICNRRCMFALMSTCILNFFVIFKQSFLTIELIKTFGIAEKYHGVIVSVPAFFQIVGAYGVGMIVDKAPKRTWIFIAFVFLSISDLLMGPSKLLQLSSLKWLFFIGQAINGTGTGMIYTPMLPEIIEAVYEKNGLVEGEDENLDAVIADKASGLYFAFFSLGTITAPPIGSVVYGLLNEDWAYTCDVFGIFGGIYSIIYLVFNLLPDIKKEKESQKQMDEKIINSEIIQQKLGIAPIISVIEIDQEEGQDISGPSSNLLQVPQSIWMSKQQEKDTIRRQGTVNHVNLRTNSNLGLALENNKRDRGTGNSQSHYQQRPKLAETSIQ